MLETLCDLYDSIATWNEETKKQVWEKWIWGSDCNSKPLEQCWDMNEMHIYGIMCIIKESIEPCLEYRLSLIDIVNEDDKNEFLNVIHIQDKKKICEFSLRELFDQIECLQLNWGKVISVLQQNTVFNLLRALMARLGEVAQNAYEFEGEVMDDPQHVTMLPKQYSHTSVRSNNHEKIDKNIALNEKNGSVGNEIDTPIFGVISRKALRQSTCVLMILFRIHFIVFNSQIIELEEDDEDVKRIKNMILNSMKSHHIESSIDFFNNFQQMVYLAPGMRLVYRTNYAGMYNDVSQVIYFHYPRFCRQPQISIDEIPSSSMHMLPLIAQIMPDIPIFYDDDSYIPGLNIHKVENNETKEPKWAWLISCSEIFLLEMLNVEKKVKAQIYVSKNKCLTDLIYIIIKQTGRKIGDEAIDTEGVSAILKNGVSLTAHGHVELVSLHKSH
jgi:hypothetical protein